MDKSIAALFVVFNFIQILSHSPLAGNKNSARGFFFDQFVMFSGKKEFGTNDIRTHLILTTTKSS